MNAPIQSDKLQQQLLFDQAASIATQPLSTTVGEIARLYDVSPSDALDEVIRTGCRSYWWNGRSYWVEGIRRLIKDSWQWDVTPEIEIDLTANEHKSLDQALGSDDAAAATAKPLRKFVASEPELPSTSIQQRQQLG